MSVDGIGIRLDVRRILVDGSRMNLDDLRMSVDGTG
jgi:hypothetical protein